MPERNANSWSQWSQSGGWKGGRTMVVKICGKMSFQLGVEERRSSGWWQWWWRKWRTDMCEIRWEW